MQDPRAIVPVTFSKRLTQAVTYGLTGGFFSPQLPLQPQHQETAGRRFDYISGYNISTRPRRDSGISFELLRNFSKSYDLLRILIEKRKDQITNFDWSVVPTDEAVANGENSDELTERAAIAQKFLKFPDGRQKWNTWLRAIIEDLLSLDAIAIWPVYQGKQLLRLETVDPATIKLVIDDSGRTPEPPFPAYQQVLHGIPTADFLKDELQYFMSNPASDRIYGLSKVEQIIITIQIGLRREISQLQFFTDGNIPAALAGVPETWNNIQIAQLQAAFDDMLMGDTGQRRKIHFVPGKLDIKELKSEDSLLKGAFDEWIIRILCFTFGIAPTPFINQVNRATAFTAQEEARDEGLGPQLTFLKSMMDSIITNCLKLEGIEFKWSMEAENDPETQANIDDKMLRNASRSLDELRQRDGLDPLGIGPMVYTGQGVIQIADIVSGKVQSVGVQPPPGTDPNAQDPNAKPAKPPNPSKEAAAGPSRTVNQTNAAGKKRPPKKGDTKTAQDGDTDAPLEQTAKKGGWSEKLGPFRKTKLFSYPSHTFYNAKGAAASARLKKTVRGVGKADR
jgi:Phage portal protein